MTLLHTTAPESTHKFEKISTSVPFIFWFIGVSCGIFGGLFYYFYHSGCNVNSIIVSNSPDKSIYDVFNEERTYLCNARLAYKTAQNICFSGLDIPGKPLPPLYCQLGNIPCSALGSFRSDLCSSTRCSTDFWGPFSCDAALNHSKLTALGPLPDGYTQIAQSNIISVEYITCEPISTSLVNAFQYTALAQLIGTMLFLFLLKLYQRGPAALIKYDTYSNILENKEHKRTITIPKTVSNDIEFAKCSPAEITIEPFVENNITKNDLLESLATTLLLNAAPKSQYRLKGCRAGIFIIWYVFSLCAIFGVLMWYFIDGGCSVQRTNVPKDLPSDYYRSTFASDGIKICSSKGSSFTPQAMGFPNYEDTSHHMDCLLNGLTCDDYGGVGTSLCTVSCNSTRNCDQLKDASVLIETTNCISLPIALMSAIQFVFIGETVVLMVFFLIYTVSGDEGWKALMKTSTYMNLWNNLKPAEDSDNESEEENGEEENENVCKEENIEEGNVDSDLKNRAEESELMDIIFHPKHLPAIAANHIYTSVAPRSTIKFDKENDFFLSLAFLFWFVGTLCAMFATLFWYFYVTSCSVNTIISDNSQSAEYYSNIYKTGDASGLYFCNSKFTSGFGLLSNPSYYSYTLDCLLPGFTPDDFEASQFCPRSNVKGTDAFVANLGQSCCEYNAFDLEICLDYCHNNQMRASKTNMTVYSVNNFNTWTNGLTVILFVEQWIISFSFKYNYHSCTFLNLSVT